MKKILGLDVGIASVGWGIIDEDGNILRAGVRLFGEADSRKKRRLFRGQRRLIRRRVQRIKDMRDLLIGNNIIDENFKLIGNPYELKLKGLTEKLSNEELATVLLHYAKRRGSSFEMVEDEEDKKKSEESTKVILSKNAQELKEKNYIVNIQLDRLQNNGELRGIHNNFKTKDYIEEIKVILNNQEIDSNLKDEIIKLIKERRHFSVGPGNSNSPSPYGRYRAVTGSLKNEILQFIYKNYQNLYLKENFNINYGNQEYRVLKNGLVVNKNKYDLIALMRGKCSIYEDQFRSPKMAFSAELFNLLNDLNNLKISNRYDNKITTLEKEKIIKHIRKKGSITPNELIKILRIKKNEIRGFRINEKREPILTKFKGYKKLLAVYQKLNIEIDEDQVLDIIIEILTETKVIDERIHKLNNLKEKKLNEELIDKLSEISEIKEYHSLSLKAIYELNNEMINSSLNQQEIITNKNLNKNVKLDKLVFDDTLILSPVAKRSHNEALKLVDQLIKEEGIFKRIVIETARDKNSIEEKKRIEKEQERNKKERDEAREIIRGCGKKSITKEDILRFRLYKDQDCKCPYTGKTIDLNDLFENSGRYQVDHIIPFSISFDNSYDNKVLTLSDVNQKKLNKTPFKYFSESDFIKGTEIKNWDVFKNHVENNPKYSKEKKKNLLFEEDITKFDIIQEFVQKNLVDTRYATKSIMMTLKNYFETKNLKTKVMTIRGKQTSYFRNEEGKKLYPNLKNSDNPFTKIRDKYIHHAIDALIIAGIGNQEKIKVLYDNLNVKDDDETLKKIKYVKEPINPKELRKYLFKVGEKAKKEDISYSWKIDSKPNRGIADQTTYSTRNIHGIDYVIKKYSNIYELKKDKLKDIFETDKKESLLVYKNDYQTFEILKKIYDQYKHQEKPFMAYKEIYGYIKKYSNKNNGPQIKSLKYIEDELGNHLDITPDDSTTRKVVKLQISPYRTDIFYSSKDKQYKFVTIRYKDVLNEKGKSVINKEWYNKEKDKKEIDSTYQFQFSLYRNSIIRIEKEEKNKIEISYNRFIATNNDNANIIEVKPINNYVKKQLMIFVGQKIKNITKYNVSITGKISKVIKEDLTLNF